MIDGIVFHECCWVVALLVTATGTKIPAGVWEGDTENTTVVKHLLADLVDRGLRFEQGLLVVIHGGKALAAGVKRVFGKHAVVQRCVLHKRCDVSGYLSPELARRIDRQLAAAFNDPDWTRGLKVARSLATQLEREHPSAAACFVRIRRHVHRPPSRSTGPARAVAVVHERHRVDDYDGASGLFGGEALAGRRHGASLGRRGDDRSPTLLPADQGSQLDRGHAEHPRPPVPDARRERGRRLEATYQAALAAGSASNVRAIR
jgi:hypothetical protein